ncbi:MAG: hypothetical protein IJ783_08005, partial [Kiritimatiellae bacterium]|nr:hypothetical protein [Kiritimatiellia bacterium]
GRTLVVAGTFVPDAGAELPDLGGGAAFASLGVVYGDGGRKVANLFAGDGWHETSCDREIPDGELTEWKFEIDFAPGKRRYRAFLGGGLLRDATTGSEWMPLPDGLQGLESVGFSGTGLAGDFRGWFAAETAAVGPAHAPEIGAAAGFPALSFAVDPETGAPLFAVRIANAEEGVWYTVFETGDLGEPFLAAADSVKAAADGVLEFAVEASAPARFVRIVASPGPYAAGDPCPVD